MNRTLQEIINQMFAAQNADPVLAGLSTSKVSVWRQIMEAAAFVIFNFQEAVNLHMNEIEDKIREQKTPSLRWYRNLALRFQYGFSLVPETDQFSPTYTDSLGNVITATPDEVAASQIVKYAAVTKVDGASKISMKIAPENGDDIFTNDQMTAFAEFLEETQAAGDHIVIVNYKPDILKINFRIVYDPLVLLSNGTSILTGSEPVKDAIKAFLKNLPFNGELSVQKLEAAVLAVKGVRDLQSINVQTKWIEPGVGYGILQPVQITNIPRSGRFTLIDDATGTEDWSGIEYILM